MSYPSGYIWVITLGLVLAGCTAHSGDLVSPAETVRTPVATSTQILQPAPSVSPTERAALAALYQATQGMDWAAGDKHWLSEQSLDNWFGVTTNALGQVTRLELSGAGLRGQLPTDLGQLTALEYLDLSANRLHGPVPAGLGHLSHLRELYLAGNAWTGCLPAGWRTFGRGRSDIGALSLPFCDTEATGAYDNPATHWKGRYRLQRRDTQVTARLRATRAPLPPAGQPGPILFTLPPGFRPVEAYTRRVWGHRVQVSGQPLTGTLERHWAHLQVVPDGTVRLEVEPGVTEPGYWAYTVTAAWEVAPVQAGNHRVRLPCTTRWRPAMWRWRDNCWRPESTSRPEIGQIEPPCKARWRPAMWRWCGNCWRPGPTSRLEVQGKRLPCITLPRLAGWK